MAESKAQEAEANNKDTFSKRLLFPTIMFNIQSKNIDELNKNLTASIYKEQEGDKEGIQRSNIKGLGGWHSKNSLHTKNEYRPLANRLLRACNRISTEMGYSSDRRLTIGQMWAIVNPPGSANRAHIHPNCLWSGVYYVQTPENSGGIEFIDPRTQNLTQQPSYDPKKRPIISRSSTQINPKPGQILIFPNWLYHSVAPNLSTLSGKEADRLVLAFNLTLVRKRKDT